jgi:hypothetical protein
MSDIREFVTVTPEGRFSLGGKRWFCNSTVYYGRYPGSCGTDWWRDGRWDKNAPEFDRDFAAMAQVGINHAAMFFHNDMFFADGKIVPGSMERMDTIIASAKKSGVRISIFIGPFIDTPAAYKQITGKEWKYDDRFLPSFNEHLNEAYVQQMLPFAERYKNEPAVAAYTDRIDRFHKGFDNVSIPFNLKDEWHQHLKATYGSIRNLIEKVGGPQALENAVKDFNDVLLPQESKWNGSLRNPLAFDYILWQKQSIGKAQAAFDAQIRKAAPNQFVWTPFEGNTNTWAMLDGFSPKTKLLHAIWMEYYFFEVTRPSYVQPFEEWVHTREIHHSRLSHQIPVVYNAAYLMCRYLKLSVQQPVVICHGAWTESPAYGTDTHEHQAAILDRVNAACLAADGDGWHYWNWRDDEASWHAHQQDRFENPTTYYFHGESLGLNHFSGHPKPALSLVSRYSRQAARIAAANPPDKKSDVLLLSSSPRMYSLFRRMALPTAAAVNGALTRCGVEPDYLWTSQDEIRIPQEWIDRYRLIVIADNMYERDFRDTPEKLLKFVEQGGTLYFALDRWDSFKDEHGVVHENPAHRKLTGVDPNGYKDWPGAKEVAKNWPFPTDASQEANMDTQAFPRLSWGVCPEFRQFVPYPEKLQLLGFRSTDDDTFTPVPGLVQGAEVIAVGKYPAGSRPLLYRHRIGKGTVYVNTWTNNLFRDNEQRQDYGGWDYDWMLDLPLTTSGARDVDLTKGASIWLRNAWGYFWRDM